MKPGQASHTAVLVCMGRAAAHGSTSVAAFDDPTALTLLPEDARARVERFRNRVRPKGVRGWLEHAHLSRQSPVMVARTVAIDSAIRSALSPQLVILGAGLDGRAWRMPELGNVTVFEVDHPDSQRAKRTRVAQLTQTAREVRFVAVDFTRDSLDEALAQAGHDASLPTTWLWEGVVMYLTPQDVAATLGVIERRSAADSRLIVMYGSRTLLFRVVGFFFGRLGEPFRSAFSADAMRALLSKHRFDVTSDDDLPTIAAALSSEMFEATRLVKHLRIATAKRR